jgi:hypothetical protein
MSAIATSDVPVVWGHIGPRTTGSQRTTIVIAGPLPVPAALQPRPDRSLYLHPPGHVAQEVKVPGRLDERVRTPCRAGTDRPCHPRATSEGQPRYRADNHGHSRTPMS